jgi:outer membrane protein assembly factor BamA
VIWRFTDLEPSIQDRLTEERFFRSRETELELSLRAFLADLNRVDFGLFFRNVALSNGMDDEDDDDSIESSAIGDDPGGNPPAAMVEERIPGYNDSYNLIVSRLKLELDSRSPDRVFTPGSGLRLELFGSFAFDPGDPALNFFRWGGEAGGFWDLSGINHVLGLHLYIEALEATGTSVVPLTERIMLGGTDHMRGFLEGTFRGDSALVLTLDYRYPIWSFLDGFVFTSLGNVFGGRFEKLHVKRLAMNWGLGFRSNTSREVSFDFLLGFGTNQLGMWDEDFKLDNVRVIFGINQGF